MEKRKLGMITSTAARIGLIVLAIVAGLMLTILVALAQTLYLDLSYMTGPEYAKPDDVITYTVIAINVGGPVQNVVLSDALPSGVTFIPGSCTYEEDGYAWDCDVDAPNPIWRNKNFIPGEHITTTFAVSVSAHTLRWTLVNHAYLSWDGRQKEMVVTTTVLPAIPKFSLFYQPRPPYADTGGTITFTVVAVNDGDPVFGVVLSDTLPSGIAFLRGSCHYDIGPNPGTGSLNIPCFDNDLVPGERRKVWEQEMARGTRITTTFAVTVTVPEGSSRVPLRNCAHLGWSIIQEEVCATSYANPTVYAYLPLTMRNYAKDFGEPNNTPEQAFGPLISGQNYWAFIWDGTDVDDYYHFTPTTTDEVTVEMTNIPEDCDPVACDYDLYVYNYDGKYNLIDFSERAGNADEEVAFVPIAGEKYYVRVRPFPFPGTSISFGFSNSQPYRLMVTYQ
jgi:uncharacterized repeat protein (TIGR01451 family)